MAVIRKLDEMVGCHEYLSYGAGVHEHEHEQYHRHLWQTKYVTVIDVDVYPGARVGGDLRRVAACEPPTLLISRIISATPPFNFKMLLRGKCSSIPKEKERSSGCFFVATSTQKQTITNFFRFICAPLRCASLSLGYSYTASALSWS